MCHALVIEDDPMIAIHIAQFATMGGATSFMIAASEDEAIAMAQARLPAVILSDVDLKAGGNGPAACASIRAAFGQIPVIFITGSPELCAACDYAAVILQKPITAHQIIAAFRLAVQPY